MTLCSIRLQVRKKKFSKCRDVKTKIKANLLSCYQRMQIRLTRVEQHLLVTRQDYLAKAIMTHRELNRIHDQVTHTLERTHTLMLNH